VIPGPTPADWNLDRFNRPRSETEDPVVKTEAHHPGERCKHWRRAPDGRLGHAPPNECLLCFGTGQLLQEVVFRFHAKAGVLAKFPDQTIDPARYRDDIQPSLRGIRGRRVA
jgi:hypothetical protein